MDSSTPILDELDNDDRERILSHFESDDLLEVTGNNNKFIKAFEENVKSVKGFDVWKRGNFQAYVTNYGGKYVTYWSDPNATRWFQMSALEKIFGYDWIIEELLKDF